MAIYGSKVLAIDIRNQEFLNIFFRLPACSGSSSAPFFSLLRIAPARALSVDRAGLWLFCKWRTPYLPLNCCQGTRLFTELGAVFLRF